MHWLEAPQWAWAATATANETTIMAERLLESATRSKDRTISATASATVLILVLLLVSAAVC